MMANDTRGTPLRDGVKMSDGTVKKHWWKEQLCPFLAEYCKGPRCMLWHDEHEACSFVEASAALSRLVELSASGGEPRDLGALVKKVSGSFGKVD